MAFLAALLGAAGLLTASPASADAGITEYLIGSSSVQLYVDGQTVTSPPIGEIPVVGSVDFAQTPQALDGGSTGLRRSGSGDDFPSGNVYCTRTWHPRGCLQHLGGSVYKYEQCGAEGSNVDLIQYNPNGRQAPRDIEQIRVSTGLGFGDRWYAPPGWSRFVFRNIPPDTWIFSLEWKDQGLVFVQRQLTLTCPSPPPPTWPVTIAGYGQSDLALAS